MRQESARRGAIVNTKNENTKRRRVHAQRAPTRRSPLHPERIPRRAGGARGGGGGERTKLVVGRRSRAPSSPNPTTAYANAPAQLACARTSASVSAAPASPTACVYARNGFAAGAAAKRAPSARKTPSSPARSANALAHVNTAGVFGRLSAATRSDAHARASAPPPPPRPVLNPITMQGALGDSRDRYAPAVSECADAVRFGARRQKLVAREEVVETSTSGPTTRGARRRAPAATPSPPPTSTRCAPAKTAPCARGPRGAR